MPFSDYKKQWVWAPLLVSIILLVGFALGMVAQRYLFNTKPLGKFLEREDPIDEIISLLYVDYVDSVDKDSLYMDAVKGILHDLDPHTVYIPSSQLAQANEILEGSGKGIGIEYFYLKDTLMVTSITENSPAAKSKLQIGDKLIELNGKLIAGPKLTEAEATAAFRNSKSDTLKLKVLRADDFTMSRITIVKGHVYKNSVDVAYMLDDVTGYIKLGIFSANSYDDFTTALQKLIDKGSKKLIVDLRGNGGGYLEEAVGIADEFLDGEKRIVYTDGKRDGKYDYDAGIDGIFEKGELIVLIDESSASASEIFAGAIQDWDRGIVMGTTSFGKGLVQEQFELSDGSAIRITTNRYFTPSGRSIQKPFLVDVPSYFNQKSDAALHTNAETRPGNVYYTKVNKRRIFGGGGITPDIFVNSNVQPQSEALKEVLEKNLLDEFINIHYIQDIKPKLHYNSFEEFNIKFFIDEDLMAQMKSFFVRNDAIATRAIWESELDQNYLRLTSKAIIAKMTFGNAYYFKTLNREDNEIKDALQIINSPLYNTTLQSHQTQSKKLTLNQ